MILILCRSKKGVKFELKNPAEPLSLRFVVMVIFSVICMLDNYVVDQTFDGYPYRNMGFVIYNVLKIKLRPIYLIHEKFQGCINYILKNASE